MPKEVRFNNGVLLDVVTVGRYPQMQSMFETYNHHWVLLVLVMVSLIYVAGANDGGRLLWMTNAESRESYMRYPGNKWLKFMMFNS